MFQIVEVRPGPGMNVEPVRRKDGTLRLFNTGKAAQKFCAVVAKGTGRKMQPRRFNKTDWKQREINRLADGAYQFVPWSDADWWKLVQRKTDHFAHVSRKYPGRIAFTENANKGIADIQTPMKAGRYLKKFCALDDTEIAKLSVKFSQQFEDGILQFAETREDIVDIYRRGPSSCMAHAAESYLSRPLHPVEAYASGDTAIAYLERDGRVTARSVVSRKIMRHSRIYGDAERLLPLLQVAGYVDGYNPGPSCSMAGMTLLAIKHPEKPDAYVFPYLDTGGRVKLIDGGKRFEVVGLYDEGYYEIDTCLTCGLAEDFVETVECEACGDDVAADDVWSFGDSTYCRSCYLEIAEQCYICGTDCLRDDMHEIIIRAFISRSTERLVCETCSQRYVVVGDRLVSPIELSVAGGGQCRACEEYIAPGDFNLAAMTCHACIEANTETETEEKVS